MLDTGGFGVGVWLDLPQGDAPFSDGLHEPLALCGCQLAQDGMDMCDVMVVHGAKISVF